MLHWNELDLIECLEVLPEVDEDRTIYCFKICKDGLQLVLTLEPYGGDIQFFLYRDGIEQHIFHLSLLNCPRIRYIKSPKASDYYREFLEFDTSTFSTSQLANSMIERGVRLAINPHISLNLF